METEIDHMKVHYVYPSHDHSSLVYYGNVCNTILQQGIRYYYKNKSFDANEVLPGLFIGSLDSIYDTETLNKAGITHIIVAIAGFKPPFPNEFNYLVVNALDSEYTDISSIFDTTNQFIDSAFEQLGKVLIVCMAGVSRSSTILAAYIISTFGVTSRLALDMIRSGRNIIEPNKEFKKQLEIFAKKLKQHKDY